MPSNRQKLYKVNFEDIKHLRKKELTKFFNAVHQVRRQGSMVVVLHTMNGGEPSPMIEDIKRLGHNHIRYASGNTPFAAYQQIEAQLTSDELKVVSHYDVVDVDDGYNELITAYDSVNSSLPRPNDAQSSTRYRTETPINIGDPIKVKKDAKGYAEFLGWLIASTLAATPTAILSYLNAAHETDSDAVAGDIFKDKLWGEMNDEERFWAIDYFLSSLIVNVPINITYMPPAAKRVWALLKSFKSVESIKKIPHEDKAGIILAIFATLTQAAVSWEGLTGQNFYLKMFLTFPGLLSTFASRFSGSFFALKKLMTLIGKHPDGTAQEEIIKILKRLEEIGQQDNVEEVYAKILSELKVDIKDPTAVDYAVKEFIEQVFKELQEAGLELPDETTSEKIKTWIYGFIDYGAMAFVGLTMYPFWAAKAVAGLGFLGIDLKKISFLEYPISWLIGSGHMLFYMLNALTAREFAMNYLWQIYETLRDNVNKYFTLENLDERASNAKQALFERFSDFEEKARTDPYNAFKELAWSLFCIPLYWSGVGLQTSAKSLIEAGAYEYLDPFTSEEWQKEFSNTYVEATNWAVIIVNLKIMAGWLTRKYNMHNEVNLESAIKFLEASKTNPLKGIADLLEKWEALLKNKDMEVVTSKNPNEFVAGKLHTKADILEGRMSPTNNNNSNVKVYRKGARASAALFNDSEDSNSETSSQGCNPYKLFNSMLGTKKESESMPLVEHKSNGHMTSYGTQVSVSSIPDSDSDDSTTLLRKGKSARAGASLWDCGFLSNIRSAFKTDNENASKPDNNTTAIDGTEAPIWQSMSGSYDATGISVNLSSMHSQSSDSGSDTEDSNSNVSLDSIAESSRLLTPSFSSGSE